MSSAMPLQPEAVTRIIEETAAKEILPRFRRLAEEDVREKGPGDLVTVADEAAERQLTQRLKDVLPGSLVVGEEAAARDRNVMEALAGDEPVWVVDPIDGTGNFAVGRPTFAVMVALVRKGTTLASWIHEPVSGRTAQAERGGGAWLDGRRIRASRPENAGPQGLQGTLHASQFANKRVRRLVDTRRARVGAIRSLRCAGAEYVKMASGEQDFSLFTKLEPWDHAPGTLLFTEAGGLARLLDGRDYAPLRKDGEGLLLAPDSASWQSLYDALFAE